MTKYVTFTERGVPVFGKVLKEPEPWGGYEGKGYVADTSALGGDYAVFEVDIYGRPDGTFGTRSPRWTVFKTKSREKAVKVARYLARMLD